MAQTEEQISFFIDDVDAAWQNQDEIRAWILNVIEAEKGSLKNLNFILKSDDGLLAINKEFLKHDYYTDVITFQEEEGIVSGEIYISADRVKAQSEEMSISYKDELHRVLIHGVLHMLGYSDKLPEEQSVIRSKEDFYLNLRDF